MTLAVTLGLVVLTIAVWVLADVWLYYRVDPKTGEIGGYPATISYLTLTSSQKRPIIAAGLGLIVGVLFGHFWWPQ